MAFHHIRQPAAICYNDISNAPCASILALLVIRISETYFEYGDRKCVQGYGKAVPLEEKAFLASLVRERTAEHSRSKDWIWEEQLSLHQVEAWENALSSLVLNICLLAARNLLFVV